MLATDPILSVSAFHLDRLSAFARTCSGDYAPCFQPFKLIGSHDDKFRFTVFDDKKVRFACVCWS